MRATADHKMTQSLFLCQVNATIITICWTKHCARNFAKHCTCIISFQTPQNPKIWVWLLFSFLQMRKLRLRETMWLVQDPTELGLKPVLLLGDFLVPFPLTFWPCTISEYLCWSSLRWPSLSKDLMWRHSQHRATEPRAQTSLTDSNQQWGFCSVALLIYVPRRERAILWGLVSRQLPKKGCTCQLEMAVSCEA